MMKMKFGFLFGSLGREGEEGAERCDEACGFHG